MTVLNEYLGFFDKVTSACATSRSPNCCRELDLAKRADFEGDKKDAAEEDREAGKRTEEAAERTRLQEQSEAASTKSTTCGKCATSTRRAPSTSSTGNWLRRRSTASCSPSSSRSSPTWSRRLWSRPSAEALRQRQRRGRSRRRRRRQLRPKKPAEESAEGRSPRRKRRDRSGRENQRSRSVRLRAERRAAKDYDKYSATKAWAK